MTSSTSIYPSGRLQVLLHLSVWLLIWMLSTAAFIRMLPVGESMLRGGVNTLLMMSLFYANSGLYHRFFQGQRWQIYFVWAIGLMLLVSALRFLINTRFSYDEDVSPYFRPGPLPLLFGVVVTNAFILLVGFLYESVLARWRRDRRQLELINEQRTAQLQFLRAQINPHFLFNTLNNIYSLAVMRSEKTAPLVMRLSDLLKYVIYEGQDEKVPLSKEVEMLEEYIDLFQLQHEEPQQISFSAEVPPEEIRVEPLLFLPIVENCFKHCDFAENEQAYASLTLRVKDDQLWFEAVNSYNPYSNQKDKTGGVGLENIRRRLALRYPEKHSLELNRENGVFEIRLHLHLPKTAQ